MSAVDLTTLGDSAANKEFIEVTPKRAIAPFEAGSIDFDLGISGHSAWLIGKSYMRATVRLVGATALTRPAVREMLALAFNSPGNWFNQVNLYANGGGGSISSVLSYYPQVAALSERVRKSPALATSVGRLGYCKGSFTQRQLAICGGPGGVAAANTQGAGALSGCAEYPENQEITRQHNPLASFNVGGNLTASNCIVSGVTVSAAGQTVTTFTFENLAAGPVAGPTVIVGDLIGATLVVRGISYPIVDVSAVGVSPATVISNTPLPAPMPAINNESNWYFIKRKIVRADLLSNEFDVVFQPALGAWVGNDGNNCLASGNYTLSFTPNTNYQLAGIETTNPYTTKAYEFSIIDMRMYAMVGLASIPPAIYSISWPDFEASSRAIGSANGGSYQFNIKSSTVRIHIFLQSGTSNSTPAFPPSNFKAVGNTDLMVNSLQVTYANRTLPLQQITSVDSYIGDGNVAATNINTFKQQYYNYLSALGVTDMLAGHESFAEWMDRGPVFSFDYSSRDSSDRSTQVNVDLRLVAPAGSTVDVQTQLFCVSEYRKVCEFAVGRGKLVSMTSSSD